MRRLLDAEGLHTLFAADRTIAEQLGLQPLSPKEAKARDHAYDADRAALAGSSAAGRAQVASPLRARHTRRAAPRRLRPPDRWLSMLDFAGRALGGGLFADGLDFLLAVVKERTDPRTLPGLEAMMPLALTRLLHHPDPSPPPTQRDRRRRRGDTVWQKLKLP